jgi:hypothetical protein
MTIRVQHDFPIVALHYHLMRTTLDIHDPILKEVKAIHAAVLWRVLKGQGLRCGSLVGSANIAAIA